MLRRAAARLGRLLKRRRPAPVEARPRPRLAYAPKRNGRPDPGEVVWAWIAYEDRPDEGKDRPVLLVGRDGRMLVGLYLSSNPARDGQPGWLRLGTGGWDRSGRTSWVRLDRTVWLRENTVRREGAILDRGRFEMVATALRARYGWT